MVIGFAVYQQLLLKRFVSTGSTINSYLSANMTTRIDKLKTDAKNIFQEGVKSVQPSNLILNSVKLTGDGAFTVNDKQYEMPQNIYVVGFGKAVAGMARSIKDIFGDKITKGILSIPSGTTNTMKSYGALNLLPKENSRFQVYEGAKNNIPDEDSVFATKQILSLVSKLKPEDLLIVLISGGGSALLSFPKPPVTLQEKSSLIKALSGKGATIQELNCVRKRLSTVKGGGLAQAAYPSQVISLILSDVIGDPLDLIASSPTVLNNDRAEKALNILEKYLQFDTIPKSILDCLKDEDVTDKNTLANFDHVDNYLIGTNIKAMQAAKTCAESLCYSAFTLSSTLSGEASNVGKHFATLARAILDASDNKEVVYVIQELSQQFQIPTEMLGRLVHAAAMELTMCKPCCILSGGETTVTVKGGGIGGRNQEMCLSFGIESANVFDSKKDNVLFLSAGTDGIDGPTDAAGAMADSWTVLEARKIHLDACSFLSNNDSYTFYKSLKSGSDHVIIGHTGTNVMDLQILLIHPQLQ